MICEILQCFSSISTFLIFNSPNLFKYAVEKDFYAANALIQRELVGVARFWKLLASTS